LTDLDLDKEIAMGLEGIKRMMHNWAVEHTLDFELVNLTMLNDACNLGLKTWVTSSGACPWGEDDPLISRQRDTRTWPWPLGKVLRVRWPETVLAKLVQTSLAIRDMPRSPS
jgi:hypothetical protein